MKSGFLLFFLILCSMPQFILGQTDSLHRPATEYRFEDVNAEKPLVFRMKKDTSSYIKWAPHYDNIYGLGVILNYTRFHPVIHGSRLGITADISSSPRLRTYYDIPLGKQRNFLLTPFVHAERVKLPIYHWDVATGNYNHMRVSGGVAFRRHLGLNHQVGADVYYRYSYLNVEKKAKEILPFVEYLDHFSFRGPEVAFIYQLNTYDNQLYPKKGARVDITYRQAFATSSFSQYSYPDSSNQENEYHGTIPAYWNLSVDMESYFLLGKKVSINTEFSFGISDQDTPYPDNFFVGGYGYPLRAYQVEFVGMRGHELLRGNYLKEKLALQVEAVSNLFFSALVNILFVSDDYKKLYMDILSMSDRGRYIGAGAGCTYASPFGPLSIYLGSRTDRWDPIWYVNMGFTF
jgi:NTE family protein